MLPRNPCTARLCAIRALYRRIDWWDKREGAMPNPDVRYPELHALGRIHLYRQYLLAAGF